MKDVMEKLPIVLADTYALYLKTQNYHWHVHGPQFKALHELFELHYRELAEAVDTVAERIVILGGRAPASFQQFEKLTTIKAGDPKLNANQMLTDLAKDHHTLVKDLNASLKLAQQAGDEGTAALLADRISAHEKACWMLNASRES